MTSSQLKAAQRAARERFTPRFPIAEVHADPELVAQEYDRPLKVEPPEPPKPGLTERIMRNRERDNGTRAKPGERTLAERT